MTDPLTVLQEVDTGDLGDLEELGGDEDTIGSYVGVESISHVSQTLSDIIRDLNVTFYVQDPEDILLDLSTADDNIRISPNLRIAAWTRLDQNRPKVPSRFQNFQVVSSTSFDSGRHYWDIEVSESEEWKVGICYPSIDRRGSRSFLGDSEKSWCLHGDQYKDYYSVIHEGKVTQLPHQITSDRVKIYLDYEAGQLSFYEQCDPIIHLHTFTATFTEPLLVALYIWKDVWEDWWNYCQ
ncbi:hypothetical protein GDO81_029524 [Engystomops pustulosus]|uniref:B30.2/SPRY domain-containing protein n=1 Tax=Engystomops pustulosus TaxID=76066 RepID=A0AAV6YG23_ENGPU|nr:hypothetical protein GDO81_029524 [Engystomops pustulosus]